MLLFKWSFNVHNGANQGASMYVHIGADGTLSMYVHIGADSTLDPSTDLTAR